MDGVKSLKNLTPSDESTFDVKNWLKSCYTAMDDDFNTPILISHLFEAVRIINGAKLGNEKLTSEDIEVLKKALNEFIFDVMALEKEGDSNSADLSKLDGVMQMLIKIRNQARADKNWALSDQVRDELMEVGIQLKDGKDGTEYSL